jgi:hypothetical protein
MMKKFFVALAAFVLVFTAPVSAQIAVPYVFQSGTTILASEVNANFDVFVQNALNRTGGTITGNIAVNPDITIDGVDISDFLLTTGHIRATTAGTAGLPAFAGTDTDSGMFFAAGAVKLSLDGVERFSLDSSGLTLFGNNIINSSGKIPALTSTYFSSLDGSAITNIPEANIIDGAILARVAASETVTGAWTFNPGTISTDIKPISVTPTWNNVAVSFVAFDINATDTASAAGSLLLNLRRDGGQRFFVDKNGKVGTTTFQMTTGATNGHVLTSDASGNASWQALPPGTTGVPSGMVAMFEASCPSGWTLRSGVGGPYENRFMRGSATFGTTGGADTHTHTIDPPNTASSTDGSHAHAVDPLNTATSTDGSHSHTPSVPSSSTDSAGSHTHDVDIGSVTSGTPSSTVLADAGAGSVGSSTHTHSFDPPNTTSTSAGLHSHSITWPNTNAGGSHSHTVDIGSTGSTAAGSHAHTLDVAAFASASGSNIPAYIQVVFCRKD